MKTGFGWYKSRGRTYHVAKCKKCGAAVTATDFERQKPCGSWLDYLSENVECCEEPDYSFRVGLI